MHSGHNTNGEQDAFTDAAKESVVLTSTSGMSVPSPHFVSIAPAWHTALLIMLLIGTSTLGAVSVRHLHGSDNRRVLNYLLTIGWEWVLAGLVYWGLHLRRTPLRQILGVRRPGAREWIIDAGIAIAFWFGSMMVLGIIALALKPLHVDPDSIRKIVSRLAPVTPLQILLWVAMSCTAGICEEFIFRGYLQQQFAHWTRHASLGLILAAIVFGFGHGYEGIAGMLLITAYGALFGVLVSWRRSLRPAIMAHAWHDSLSGIALFVSQHYAHRTFS